MARKFLYFVAIVIFLVIAGAIALNLWSKEATELAFVPRSEFTAQPALDSNAYADPAMWYARPGMGAADPVRFVPQGAPTPAAADAAKFAVFFVHPTSYIRPAIGADAPWNAPIGDSDAETRARLFLRGMASPFAAADEVWAPKYRQAVIGAFLTDKAEANQALDLAYRDVAQAFDFFVATAPKDEPIVLAGHSQGALMVLRLLREKVIGTPLAQRIAMVYPVGWPVSVEHDLPALGLPACATPDQAGCIATWSSFAEPADPALLFERFTATPGFDGQPRGDGAIVCTNPLTGTQGGTAPAEANLGTLKPASDFSTGELIVGAVAARCDPDTGLLLIGDPPDLGPGVLPGNNYHVYDIPLFWANLKADVARRLAAWKPAT
ncbi:DUF3089 domain-containing protein [Altererythrobacter sp. TH136]|uniref:DUF3089 domain-containing protein n=1 Tax=Altererythrobacter sp. TH136 TaxID=2067415 RepID=UPI001164A8BB|nr:DUF3089 domain-containing protein [Altererythrobacter sp. TH136]QDM41729.1 DUF3089 domain-containing protein [Altererythrobacter sp. TH136]